MALLEVKNLFKAFGGIQAVSDCTFSVEQGSITGLIGPNGAGKTTMIRMITGITGPDEGRILVDGAPLREDHIRDIGYMPEERGLYKKMKVGDQLIYLARLKGMSSAEAKAKIKAWMERFDVKDWWDKKIEELSKGMQQKVQFIATVVHEPKLLILDEPFSGLDPINTNLIKDEIHRMNEAGTSVIFSTHRMEQVEEICEQIALVNKGKLILTGPMQVLKDQFKKHVFKVGFSGPLPESIRMNYQIDTVQQDWIKIKLEPEQDSNQLLQEFLKQGCRITLFQEVLPTLNEIFIEQVGESNRQLIH